MRNKDCLIFTFKRMAVVFLFIKNKIRTAIKSKDMRTKKEPKKLKS